MGDLWIKGGTVVTAEGTFVGDVIIRGGRIETVLKRSDGSDGTGTGPRGADRSGTNAAGGDAAGIPVLDASGKHVLPGLIDVHVHFRDPGLTQKEDFFTGTRAAANGGVTTVLDMPNTLPPVASADVLRAKMAAVQGRAWVDYGIYGLIDEHNLDELPAMADAGAIGFKLFLGPTTGNLRAPGWGRLIEVFECVRDIGLPLVIHAEDRDVIEYWTTKVGSAARKATGAPRAGGGAAQVRQGDVGLDYRAFLATRPRFGEVAATQTACLLAQMTGTPIHIAHVALAEAVEVIRQAKAAGAPVTAETCPPFLTMTAEDCEAAGPVAKMLPPVREREDREALWAGLRDGTIDLIATDHAPHEAEAKVGSWLEAAGGMAGVETVLPILLTEVHRGRLSLNELVRWTSREPARVFGLRSKGELQAGFDGDVVIVDMEADALVAADGPRSGGAEVSRRLGEGGNPGPGARHSLRLLGKSTNTPLLGRVLKGAVSDTVLRGRVVSPGTDPTANPGGAPVVRMYGAV